MRLHTRFLHMLLNPTGNHDCERLFLDLFLDTLLESDVVDHEGESVDLTDLIKALKLDEFKYGNNEESRSPYGQFDLYLEFKNHIILIENKIHAGEGDKQLERYASFLEKETNKTPLLLYLTLDGKRGETANGKPYARISYKDHILQWLGKCLQATYSFVNINQSLQQYTQVVEQLTGQNQYGRQDMEEMKRYLEEHPEIIKNLDAILQTKESLYYDIIECFFMELGLELERSGIEWKPRYGADWSAIAKDPWCGVILHPEKNDFSYKRNFEIWLERSELWNALYIGLESNEEKPRLTDDEQLILNKVYQRLRERSKQSGMHLADAGHSWGRNGEGAIWPVGRHDILEPFSKLDDTDSYLELLNPVNRARKVSEAKDRILEYIEILQHEFQALEDDSAGESE